MKQTKNNSEEQGGKASKFSTSETEVVSTQLMKTFSSVE